MKTTYLMVEVWNHVQDGDNNGDDGAHASIDDGGSPSGPASLRSTGDYKVGDSGNVVHLAGELLNRIHSLHGSLGHGHAKEPVRVRDVLSQEVPPSITR